MGRKAAARLGRAPTPPPGGSLVPQGSLSNADMSLPEISDNLIEFVTQSQTPCEPPRKRQKITEERHMGAEAGMAVDQEIQYKNGELAHIIVKQSMLEIKCAGSKLSGFELPLRRDNIQIAVNYPRSGQNPTSIHLLDDRLRYIFRSSFPEDEIDGLQDILLALQVHMTSKKWAMSQGRPWTEVGVVLLQTDGMDILQIVFTVKWNVTTSPYDIIQANSKVPVTRNVLSNYFPDSNVSNDTWSPQDFYQSVYSPSKDDNVAASIQTSELESNLYPFQKRALQWLLRREGVEWSGTSVQDVHAVKGTPLPISFIKVKDARGRSCYVSHLFGLITLDITPFVAYEQSIKGGILAEEMGLGKTIEMISLMTLHKRPRPLAPTVFDMFTAEHVRPTSASLIVTPPSILEQWISEVKKHAPHLKVIHYDGIKSTRRKTAEQLVNELATSDIVVTTYSVFNAEINYTVLNPEKKLRRESKYPRTKSPLMQLSWWRVIMDEAQEIESGVSKAAVVARMIPRINAWCVTGTPVRKDVKDLLGLLIFLRFEPYASIKHVWSSLTSSNKHEFRKLFGLLALRHSKQSVRDELKLPSQQRFVITMPFTPIEEQHYQELFNQMCDESGLDPQGVPLLEDWDPEAYADIMRKWLVRLRKTALHPQVRNGNGRAVGHKDGPLRTVDQVLDVMMDQADVAIRTDQRTLLSSKLKRGQMFENSPRVKEALAIWDDAAKECASIVQECQQQLQDEQNKIPPASKAASSASRDVSGDETESLENQDDVDPSSRLGVFRNRLRSALEIEHMAVFFRANAYFQIKSNEEMTQPGSPEFHELEKLEMEGYETAKKLRRQILQEVFRKADKLMRTISKKASANAFLTIPEFPSNPPKGGLESRRIMERLDNLAAALDAQANNLDEWRNQTIQFLLRPLVDEDEGIEITGDEYEESTKTQDEVMVYVQALRTAIADRHCALTGQENLLVQHEVKTSLRIANVGEGAFPEKTIELLNICQNLKPTKDMGCIRGIVVELRALASSLRPDAEGGNSRAQNELAIVDKQLKAVQTQLTAQTKATAALEKETELFTSLMNTRLEYYRQLQQVSDMVAPYEGPNSANVVVKMLREEDKLVEKIATAKAKRRYLVHLRHGAGDAQEHRMCIICRETIEVGALTVCGHQYCKECIGMWWRTHHNCPICKARLIPADLHPITYKPQVLSIQTEGAHDVSQGRNSPSSKSRKSAIYAEINKRDLAEIKKIDLDGPSFTTKIDTLARHLIWLRESDPGAKSIIFSQFKVFLNHLARAFATFRIGFSAIDKADGIEKFKEDPSVECFLLHARAHSSGLNLVNASHVFLCEPLINTALELQAIARVDRIGQQQETNVWLYLVDGTVEESIHQLSVKRRMEHMVKTNSTKDNGKGKAKELTPDEVLDANLEAANSMELQQASLSGLLAKRDRGDKEGERGEMVKKEDLWDCLFGGVGQRRAAGEDRQLRFERDGFNSEVRRHLAAEAAEERMVIDDDTESD